MIISQKAILGPKEKGVVDVIDDLEYILGDPENDREEAYMYVIDALSKTIKSLVEEDRSTQASVQHSLESRISDLAQAVGKIGATKPQESIKPLIDNIKEVQNQMTVLANGLKIASPKSDYVISTLGSELARVTNALRQKNKTEYHFEIIRWPGDGHIKEVIAKPKTQN